MASINNTTNNSSPLSQSVPVRMHIPEQRKNLEPLFSHVVMPEANPLSNRSVEKLPGQASSIPISIPSFSDLHRTPEKEKAFTSARAVFFEDDLESPSLMSTISSSFCRGL